MTIGTTSIGLARWVAERSPDREARCAVDLRRSGKRIQRRAEEVRTIQLGAIVGHRPRLALGVLSSDHARRSPDVPCSRRGKWATHRFGEEAANAYKKYLSMGRRYGRFFWDQALDFGQYEVGDCTFHSGWTTHAAPPAVTNKGERHKKIPREAVTVSFIDGAARKVPKSVWYRGSAEVAEEDYISYGRWYDKVPDGEFLESDILPVMWPREGNQSGEPRGDAEL